MGEWVRASTLENDVSLFEPPAPPRPDTEHTDKILTHGRKFEVKLESKRERMTENNQGEIFQGVRSLKKEEKKGNKNTSKNKDKNINE